jgi:biopolymer transport protein ExbB
VNLSTAVILFVGILGIVLAMYQYFYLFIQRSKVLAQLKNLKAPNSDNPLGRVLLAMHEGDTASQTVEVVELRFRKLCSEVPELQRFQASCASEWQQVLCLASSAPS